MKEPVTPAAAREIEQACVCVGLQRVARIISRQYDRALRPVALSNWQFTILMKLCRSETAGIGELANELGMDRTTVTASLKPLERRGLVATVADPSDRRLRLPALTTAGHALLAEALPLWRSAQAASAESIDAQDAAALRRVALALTPERTDHSAP